jgi:predicted amidophosphoribosyltransferase
MTIYLYCITHGLRDAALGKCCPQAQHPFTDAERLCDRCRRPMKPGRFSYLCGPCATLETTMEELRDRRSYKAWVQ